MPRHVIVHARMGRAFPNQPPESRVRRVREPEAACPPSLPLSALLACADKAQSLAALARRLVHPAIPHFPAAGGLACLGPTGRLTALIPRPTATAHSRRRNTHSPPRAGSRTRC